jgi:parallel beta-helix repeat protein
MKSIGIVIGAIFVVMIFIGMAFVPGLGMSEDNVMEKWMQDHTVKVNATTTCKYEQGQLLIKEVYTGKELKERFGIEQFTKELKIPVEAEVLGEGKLRHWWDNYTYPQWVWSKSGDIYEKEDPINLAWENTTKNIAKSEILEEGWYDWGTWYDFYVYDPVYGWINDDNVANDPFGVFGRYHARLWQMSDGDIVANAHHDTPVPHEADELEEAEELVAGYFAEPDDTEWNVYEDSYNLDNNVTSPYSDGWCSQISYGSATWYVPDDYLKIQWAVDNATTGDTIIVRDGTYTENVDVNKSLTIQSENGSDSTIVQAASSSDHILEVTVDYVNISGFTVEGGATGGYPYYPDGIYLCYADYCNISNNNCSNNRYGIYLESSNNNVLSNNNCSIYLEDSSNNMLMDNIALDNGILMVDSGNNTLSNNNASNNDFGILLRDSCDNTLTNNKMSGNDFNFGVLGSCLSHYINNIDTSNLVDGKPIYYWVKEQNKEVPSDAGFVGIVNCTNITVRDLTLKNNGVGVILAYSNNSRIQNVNAFHNWFSGISLWYSNNNTLMNNTASNIGNHGIYLKYSSNNKITNNTASNNVWCITLGNSSNNTITRNNAYMNYYHGILLSESSNDNLITGNNALNNYYGIHLEKNSSNNKIYFNNFISNTDNVYSRNSTNIWNSTDEITYTYNGSEFENYLGNYWDDYTFAGNDTNNNGIGDTPYSINSDNDSYPLMGPWENYFAPTENIFYTGSSANPYPSIMGIHNGTIKLNQTITVSQLYTYPCVGTGGHTEYAMIWNKAIGEYAVAEWNGYIVDYHNISFNKTLTLKEGVIYNYTIRTGSYPQVHHKFEVLTANGWMNCSKFTDANGKEYNNWIPAIKLFL